MSHGVVNPPPDQRKICVIGLGYVGLPVAIAFGTAGFDVVGFDIDQRRIDELNSGHDRTRECDREELTAAAVTYTAAVKDLESSNFFIVTVPTPIDDAKLPDMTALRKASETVGKALKAGDIVVYESTVYPGATEEVCVPILERVSGLRFGLDFFVGYSPERINPGDRQHRFETIRKVVSGCDAPTARIVAETYGAVVKAGVFMASSIQVAEAAKVIENTQRDINIGFVNELSLIFGRMGLDTNDILDAAGTKWNFLNFRPGLVGGHCIGVDPYYLTYQAERYGHHASMILSGRRLNDEMGQRIARECIKRMLRRGGSGAPYSVVVLGLTFKENVPDLRNSKVIDIIRELQDFGVTVHVADAVADHDEAMHEYGVQLTDAAALPQADAVILAVQHRAYVESGWAMIGKLLKPEGGVVLDIKGVLDRGTCPGNIDLWRL